MQSIFSLLAQAPAKPGGSALDMLLPFALIMIIFYFVLIRPQKKRQKQLQAMVGAMKTGDRVVSAGGIHGLVANVKERTVLVKIADNVKIEFEKSSIATVIKKGEEKGDTPAPQIESQPVDGAK